MCCSEGFMKSASKSRFFLLSILMAALIVTGIVNFVLVKVLFVSFKSTDPNNPSSNGSALWNLTTAITTAAAANATSQSGAKYSFFVNQGINFFYIIVGGLMVYPRQCCTNDITPEMLKIPQRIFFFMALLDAFGTFFISMGAVYTPGQIQPLINQVSC